MGMEGMRKEKRKIALEILDEADKIVRLAKMLADEDDPFARRGLYAFLDAEMKALRTLVIWCFPQNNSPFSLYRAFSAPPPRLGLGPASAVRGKRGELFPVCRLHINRFHVDVGWPALGGAEPNALRGPGAPGHIAGSLRQPSAQRFMHARSTARTRHPPCAFRGALVS
jgi:hypothetical protein